MCSRATSRSAPDTPLTEHPTRFEPEDWARLTFYSHTHKRRAFEVYSSRYLKTSGQIYWADSQLSAAYVDNYHADLDRAVGAAVPGSEMITEIYVQRPQLCAFMDAARDVLRHRRANMIYGTVRLIERDDETFLAWARDRYACVIFNLHIEHTPQKIEEAAAAFRDLIDLGIAHGGSYYLTYHRWARRDQVERCYPQMPEFSGIEAAARPGRTVPEHLVSPLSRHVQPGACALTLRDGVAVSLQTFDGRHHSRRRLCSWRLHERHPAQTHLDVVSIGAQSRRDLAARDGDPEGRSEIQHRIELFPTRVSSPTGIARNELNDPAPRVVPAV